MFALQAIFVFQAHQVKQYVLMVLSVMLKLADA